MHAHDEGLRIGVEEGVGAKEEGEEGAEAAREWVISADMWAISWHTVRQLI